MDDFVNIKDLFTLFLHKWYWFVISVILSLTVALTYIVITPPTYTRSASFLIKNNNNTKRPSLSSMEPLADIGLFNQTTDAQSEIHQLKSPQLMESVVNRLKLNYNYNIKYKGVRNVDLYNNTPVIVCLDTILNKAIISFEIILLKSDSISLVNFNINDQNVDYHTKGKLTSPVITPYGIITVDTTAIYSPSSVGKTIIFSKENPHLLAKSLIERLSAIIPEKDVPVIELSYVDVSAQRAEDILNSLLSIYNENWIKDKNQITSSTSQFIDYRLDIIENELGVVDKDISTFKSENLLPDVKAVSSIYLAQSESNTSKLIILQNQLSMAQYIQNYIQDAGYKNELIPANTGIDNNAIENQIDKYNTILLQKNNLITNSSEQNPVVADMIKSLNSIKEVIVRSIDDYISTLNIQLKNIRQEEKVTNSKIASNPNQAKYLLSVERQQKVKESLYLFLLQKREENELSQTFTAYNTKVINLPDGDIDPTAPRRKIIMLAALIVGLIIPALLLFMIDNLDTLVRGRKDLSVLSVPFVGEIPIIGRKKRLFHLSKSVKNSSEQRVNIVVSARSRNIINEAFRNVRNNIDFMRPKEDNGTVIMSTSLFAGSGKTFITSNIALGMALKGSRTILLDVDLRKATLSRLIDSPKQGLSDYLAGKVSSVESIITKSKHDPCLDILPAGKMPPNPSELILGHRFTELIADLRTKYDYIFLDCPPVEIVSETAIIGGLCNMTLFIIRVGMLDKRILPEIEQIYKNGHYKSMGIILNDVDFSTGKYGYGKYGYGKYGYGNNSDNDIE